MTFNLNAIVIYKCPTYGAFVGLKMRCQINIPQITYVRLYMKSKSSPVHHNCSATD